MKACPRCVQENADAATVCYRCRTSLLLTPVQRIDAILEGIRADRARQLALANPDRANPMVAAVMSGELLTLPAQLAEAKETAVEMGHRLLEALFEIEELKRRLADAESRAGLPALPEGGA